VAQGEIVGVFGLVGAGRTELLKAIYGAARPIAGTVRVHQQIAPITGPASAIRHGITFCPEDRKQEGIVAVRSVAENINLSVRRTLAHLGAFIGERREQQNAQAQVDRLRIRTPSLGQLAMNLSGGNQQKVVLARWLSERVKVMLLDEPTRGIDIGAKREIYELIFELARQGIGVLVVSSELPEVLGICDRILVMRQGAIVASLSRDEATEERILRLALPVGATVKNGQTIEAKLAWSGDEA
jgi:L-arabinose transport system ATP-binding protein